MLWQLEVFGRKSASDTWMMCDIALHIRNFSASICPHRNMQAVKVVRAQHVLLLLSILVVVFAAILSNSLQ